MHGSIHSSILTHTHKKYNEAAVAQSKNEKKDENVVHVVYSVRSNFLKYETQISLSEPLYVNGAEYHSILYIWEWSLEQCE